MFLCHAWDDREGIAKDLHDLLEGDGVTVWFSERDVRFGTPFVCATKGSRGRVPESCWRPRRCSLSELLAREHLIPVVHSTTFDALGKSARCLPRDPD